MRAVLAGLSGLLFGCGLAISGMIDPARVLGFLDPFGRWDPTLAFVLGGAVLVSGCGTLIRRAMRRPILAEHFDLPATRPIDARLLAGAAIFGVGWGLAGFCPGPALADLSLGRTDVLVFVAAMLIGMVLHRLTAQPGEPAGKKAVGVAS